MPFIRDPQPVYGDLEGHDPEAFLAEQAAERYPLFRSVDPIELATDDVAPSALVDAALDALVGRGREG